ncbi:unnamed protein product [Diabrotica balteata]|uniref:Uncharacterized protein n=1 Tax=Diabrotica balteata TaxID=107213 RepID=A0A9N9X940_DIABA|nr:unnamed protein product [Diabrotica balteata]
MCEAERDVCAKRIVCPLNSPCEISERYVYKFVCDPEALFSMAYGSNSESTLKFQSAVRSDTSNIKSESQHHLAYSDMLNFYNCGIAHSYQHLHPYLQESKHTRFT